MSSLFRRLNRHHRRGHGGASAPALATGAGANIVAVAIDAAVRAADARAMRCADFRIRKNRRCCLNEALVPWNWADDRLLVVEDFAYRSCEERSGSNHMSRTGLASILLSSVLAMTGCAPVSGPSRVSTIPTHPGVVLTGTLDAKAEVPGPGEQNGTGEFTGFFDVPGGQVCYNIGLGSLTTITMMHIHKGDPGVAGPPVITLGMPTGMHGEGCLAADKGLLSDIIAHPTSYYVNVHTVAHPGGAIRSQLQRPAR